jgi:hypothetical protein
MKVFQILEQFKVIQMSINDLVDELEFELKNELVDQEKYRKPRTTLSSYKRYNLDIPYKLHKEYKDKFGDSIQWDGNHWFWIGQLSKMPHILKKIKC